MLPSRASSQWRRHSLSAWSEVLISAPSLRRSALCVALSSLRSVPAQSTSVSTAGRATPPPPPPPPRGGLPVAEPTVRRMTACEREDSALAPVDCVARLALACSTTARKSAAQLSGSLAAPSMQHLPEASCCSRT